MNSVVHRVLIADDHELIRRGFCDVIREDPSLQLVAECANGKDAWDRICELEPDLAVLDINMPVMNGLAVTREIHKRHLPVQVIVLTMHKEKEFFTEAIRQGVRGYVLKDEAVRELRDCLLQVAAGKFFVSASFMTYLIEHIQSDELPELRLLTATERRILKLVAQGKTSKEIAEELFVSVRTVETHRHNMCRKMNLTGTHALLQFAIENLSRL